MAGCRMYLNLSARAERAERKPHYLRLRSSAEQAAGFRKASSGLGSFSFNALLRFLPGVPFLGVVPLVCLFTPASFKHTCNAVLLLWRPGRSSI